MAIKTEIEEVEKDTIVIKIEVPPEEIAEHINKAYRDVAKKVRIPGFRKGKAPKQIIDQMVGAHAVLEEALQEIIPDVYPEAVKSAGVVPVTMPEVNVVQIKEGEPLIFTAKVQVKPEVKLGSLEDLEISEIEKADVDAEVNDELEKLRNKFATLEVVEGRQSRKGDFVLIDYEGFIEGKPFEGGRGSDFMLELGSGAFIPGFEDQLVDLDTGADSEVKVTFPAEYQAEHLAGKEASFSVHLKEIKSKKLPELDDEFAQSVSKFDTLDELQADLGEKVAERAAARERSARRENALGKMVEISEIDLPSGMVERRIDQMVQSFAEQVEKYQKGMTFDRWLQQTGMDFKEFRNNYREEAEKALKTELTLEAVADQFELVVTDEDIETEIKRLADGSGRDAEELTREIEEREGYDFLKERLAMDKAVEFLGDKAKVVIGKNEEKRDDANESSADSS